ncbi:hypothetical protein SUGI_0595330 [Cryptomeria japonica]|uniref:reticulon-like protein B12 n=1 Tax=Cryptomeria japonica TaxID=3369 RepID=UPI0024148AF3|nr:reticulon-like protein B12 [Cryptomeria japonica]GLJ30101.1 hypothetical protein SUGI_0595330 [Cryptomeria japonica]
MAESSEMPSVGVNDNAVMDKSPEVSQEFVAPKALEEMLPENPASKPSEDVSSQTVETSSPKPLETPASKSREASLPKPSEPSSPEALGASREQGPSTPYRLFNRQRTIHEVLGGGQVADVILWRKKGICIGLLLGGGATWYFLEKSEYSFISVVSSVLLFVVVLLFGWAKTASILQRPLPTLPDLTLSEEMVTRGAAKLCEQINCVLAIAHDFAAGKNKKLFAKVASILLLLSVIGGMCNFLTIVYICLIFSLIIPALYNKYEDHVDSHAERALKEITKQTEVAQRHILKHYKNLDEKVISKIPRGLSNLSKISKDKTL